MQWIELTIKTTPAAIDLVCDRLTVLGFDSFIIDDQEQFHDFLEQNRQYWDYVDEGLEKQMEGLSQIRLYLEQSASAPGEYLTRLRLTRAKELLRATDLPVSEVAYRVGMENTSYFISVFRAREGATPQQYRRRWSPVA